MCSTVETVRSTSITGEFNGPGDVPPGIVTDATIERFIEIVKKNRWQLIQDFGCSRTTGGSNTVPDLIDLEVAHWLKMQLMLETGPANPGDPPPIGLVSEGTIARGGSRSTVKRAVAPWSPEQIIEDNWAMTPYGIKWYQLWRALPPEMTTANKPGAGIGPLPIWRGYGGPFGGGLW